MSRNDYYEEPVVLTLSSDEDEETSRNVKITSNTLNGDETCDFQQPQALLEPINPKEPIILPNTNYEAHQLVHSNFKGGKIELHDEKTVFISIQCRSLRIGSYKVVPCSKLLVNYKGFEVSVPPFAQGDQNPVPLCFHIKGIRKVLAHFGHSLPVIYIYITEKLAEVIRQSLKMFDRNGFYIDPCSQEESQRRVTLLIEQMNHEAVYMFKNILKYESVNPLNEERLLLFEELSMKDANEILVRSSPVEIESVALNSRTAVTYETKTLLVFPPPPNKGGITITMDDYCCLKDEQFLNDVLLDFYLKWMHMCHISAEDRERTHIFSTFFYKRLTSKPKNVVRRPPSSEDDPNLTAAQRRHSRVQSWTKNVDIFSKDFILIPINEQSHWFLAVICFPYLDGPIKAEDGTSIPFSEVSLPTRFSARRKRRKIEIPVIDDDPYGSDRDEAEGDETELVEEEEDEGEGEGVVFDESFFYSGNGDDFDKPSKKRQKTSPSTESIKQPCILILDSLSGSSSRSRIVSTLRDYLAVEYMKRKKKEKKFTKDTMMGTCPKVPQQMNYSDCGLFTLQFAESFFERPLKDFRLPIKSLCSWFNQDEVTSKRESIANLIKSLMDKYKPNHGITLPPISFTSSSNCESVSLDATSGDLKTSPAAKDNSTESSKDSSSAQENGKVETAKEKTVKTPPREPSSNPAAETGLSSSIKYLCSLIGGRETAKKVEKKSPINVEPKIPDPKPSSTPSVDSSNSDGKSQGNEKGSNSPRSQEGSCGVLDKDEVNSSLKLLCDSYDSEEDEIFPNSTAKRLKITSVDL